MRCAAATDMRGRGVASAGPEAEEGGPRGKHGFPRARDTGAEGLEPPAYGFGDRRSTN